MASKKNKEQNYFVMLGFMGGTDLGDEYVLDDEYSGTVVRAASPEAALVRRYQLSPDETKNLLDNPECGFVFVIPVAEMQKHYGQVLPSLTFKKVVL